VCTVLDSQFKPGAEEAELVKRSKNGAVLFDIVAVERSENSVRVQLNIGTANLKEIRLRRKYMKPSKFGEGGNYQVAEG
jgi:hypothetical protein